MPQIWATRKPESYESEERSYWTHQIPKDIFPDAPEKAKTVDCFRAFTPETSVDMVVKKCGRPDEEVGSGISIFLWQQFVSPDGSTVSIGTPYLERFFLATNTKLGTPPSGDR